MPIKVQKTKKFYEILNIMNLTGAKIALKKGTIALICSKRNSFVVCIKKSLTDFEDPSLKPRAINHCLKLQNMSGGCETCVFVIEKPRKQSY